MGQTGVPPLGRRLALWGLLVLAQVVPGVGGAAVYDPALRWRTRTTEHFRIHYPEELSGQAEVLARAAEEVHGPMVEVVGWEPAQRTEVTLVDRTDLGNGYTTIFPYSQIRIFPVPPPMLWTVGDYDGWLRPSSCTSTRTSWAWTRCAATRP